MNHNPHNLQDGQHVILDKDFANSSEVVIYVLTPLEMYATVYSANETGDMWQVMTKRLSPIPDTPTPSQSQ